MENKNEIKTEQTIPPKKHEVRRMESDLAEEVKEHQGAVVQIAISQYEEKEKEKENLSIKSKKNIFFLVVGILFLATAFMFIFYFSKNNDIPVKINTNIENQIITSDQNQTIDISGLSKIKIANKIVTISKEYNEEIIKNITLVENGPAGLQKIGLQRFFTIMEMGASEKLLASLSDDFMIGSYTCPPDINCKISPQLFIISKMINQNLAFQGMQDWENQMQNDLSQIFKIQIPDKGLDSSFELSFQNEIINNKNARVLKNKSGESVGIIYIYPGKNILIISNEKEALVEITSRLSIQ